MSMVNVSLSSTTQVVDMWISAYAYLTRAAPYTDAQGNEHTLECVRADGRNGSQSLAREVHADGRQIGWLMPPATGDALRGLQDWSQGDTPVTGRSPHAIRRNKERLAAGLEPDQK